MLRSDFDAMRACRMPHSMSVMHARSKIRELQHPKFVMSPSRIPTTSPRCGCELKKSLPYHAQPRVRRGLGENALEPQSPQIPTAGVSYDIMSLGTVSREQVKLRSTSLVVPDRGQRGSKIGTEIAVIGRIDPERRHPCSTAVRAGRLDQTIRRTNGVGLTIGVPTTTTREVDNELNARRVPRSEG